MVFEAVLIEGVERLRPNVSTSFLSLISLDALRLYMFSWLAHSILSGRNPRAE